jgi:hypothetical protein
MARRKSKNPKARSAAAKKLLAMSMKKKMMRGGLQGNGMADNDKAPQRSMQMDSGNPGEEMK